MPTGMTASEVTFIKRHFLSINRERLRRAQGSLRQRQRDFLDILPLLFHANNPLLPGYISDTTPVGISDYSPDKRTQEAAKKLNKKFSYKRKALPRYDILSLFLIGSSGTIAHSQKSDFDVWVCHHKSLSPSALSELQAKAHAIEKWGLSLEMEVHFFFMDPGSFKAGNKSELTKEGSGSAQHYILLEEFYRTSLLLAGRYPAWWLVPPTSEGRYDEYLAALKDNGIVRETEYVDFGAIPQIPAEEFFGAAVWQLFKGIDAPYKSVLKLLLMEVYAYHYPESDLLCQRFKRAIYEGEINLDQLDPYIMLYHKIAEHLQQRGAGERLDLFRRCFYFKVAEKLSAPDLAHHNNWRRDLMRTLVQSWEWDDGYLSTLDTRTYWKINRVLRERKILTAELTQSYKFLSDFAHRHAQLTSINQQDLNILGRKLYAAFEKKPGKIEVVNCGISQHLDENYITFHQAAETNYQDNWSVYIAPLHLVESGEVLSTKRSASIVELIAWCHFNELINNGTVIALHTENSALTIRETKAVLACLQRLFPSQPASSQSAGTAMECFAVPSKATKVALFVNLGIEPMAMQARLGIHYTSNKTDALSYGGIGENLALTFDVVTLTNWREILTQRYAGLSGIMKYLGDYIHETPPSKGAPAPISVFCFSSAHSSTISKRIDELFQNIITCFYRNSHARTIQYIMAAEHMYYALWVENDTLHCKRMGAYQDLLNHLAAEHASYSPAMVDPHALCGTPLPIIFKLDKPGIIQLFYYTDSYYTDIYVTDEQGSLYYQHIMSTDSSALINQFTLFFDALAPHPGEKSTKPDGQPETIEIHQLTKGDAGHFSLAKSAMSVHGRPRNYFDIQVAIDKTHDDKLEFTVNCGNNTFTSLAHGNNLFLEVARHVITHRQSGAYYPIYITRIELPEITNEHGLRHRQTISFLNYKKIIENKLQEALAILGKSPLEHQSANTRRNQTPMS